ncbi:NBR1-Ig-like domain-containing protein [Actinoplanes sp. CA-142083]|uniref:NBR1-Ig-like domain-containing protein n=1 Tax=Actinoplanes sp. CA-142083 TaxID=3239903 RepID=UPI003D90BD1A
MEAQRAATEPKPQVTAAERFAGQLRALRTGVGDPSFRKMAGRSGRISHTTLHEAAAGTRFPSWETTREFVRACEADEAEWRLRWEQAQGTAPPHIVDTVVTPSEFVPAPSRALEVVPRRPVITIARRRWWPWAAVAAVVAIVAVVGFTNRSRARQEPGAEAPSASSSDALVPGDASRFVGDVTIPDGTKVKVKSHFVKVWAIANVGTVGWHHRYLARAQPAAEDGCQVPSRVEIGDTLPGEQVMISVPVVASSTPGRCWVSWKMVDEQGRPFFPTRRPVYFLVNVTN